MKKVLLLVTAVLAFAGILSSCSLDDKNVNFDVAFLPAVNVEAPEYMNAGTTYSFKLYYNRPTDCYYYDGLYTDQDGNDFTVAVRSIVLAENCHPLESTEPEVATFEFACPQSSFTQYTFHFYAGQSVSGEDVYTDVVVPVQ